MKRYFLVVLLLAGAMAACSPTMSPVPSSPTRAPAAATPSRTPSPTPFLPSPTPSHTPEPLALRVNGEAVPLAVFQAEVARLLQQAPLSEEEARRRVLDDLIAQLLLAQAARAAGFSPDVEGRWQALVTAQGGEAAFQTWLEENNYTPAAFRNALERAMEAAWMRDQILASVPEVAEQVHARQLFVYNEKQAQDVLARVQAGADFAQLVARYDPVGQGDLGWFPRGYLLEPTVEAAAFALAPGEISQPVPAQGGYYLIQVLERDPQRPLTPEMRLRMQAQTLQAWIEQHRTQAQIELFVEP